MCVHPEVPAPSPPYVDATLITTPTKRRLISPSTKESVTNTSTEENCGAVMGERLHEVYIIGVHVIAISLYISHDIYIQLDTHEYIE